MLKVCLTIDCEKFISFKQGNPKWGSFERLKGKVNNLIKNIRYNKNGFEVVCKTLVKENFPATMMLVGSLFPKQEPVKNIEWGYHTLNHLPLTLINDESLQQEVKNIYRAKSFSAPMWMIEDIKAPSRIFSLLKKQGYTHAVYDGENDGIKSFHYRAIKMPCKKEGIVCIHLSNVFEGNWNKTKMNNLKEDLINNLNKEGIYLITTHDFTHKSPDNLVELITLLKNLQSKGKIKIVKFGEI